MSAKVYNHASKQWEEINDDAVDAAVKSGNYTFEAGIKVPVVADDGELGYVPSENLHEAFNSGFRWQTQADKDTAFAKSSEAIKEEHAGTDSTGTALLAGLARGATLGASDIALKAAGLGEITEQIKERNPIASTVGSIASLAVPLPLPRGLGGVTSVGKLGTRVGEAATGLIKGGEEAVQLTRAQKALRGVGTTALGSAAEGAFFGLGEGVSEAALGKPEDIVDNLASGIGFGTLAGGVFGAGFGAAREAKPFLQSAFDKTASTTDNLIQGAARKSTTLLGKAVLSVTENAKVAKEFGDLGMDQEFRHMVSAEGMDKALEFATEMRRAKAELQKEGKALNKVLGAEVKKAQNVTAQEISDRMSASQGDVNHALKQTYSELEDIGSHMDDIQRVSTGPALVADEWVPAVKAVATRMEKSGNPVLEAKASEIFSKLEARGGEAMTAGDELEVLRKLKQDFSSKERGKLGLAGKDYALAEDVEKLARGHLYNYPDEEFANSYKAWDKAFHSYKVFEGAVKKYKGQVFVHPESLRGIAPTLQHIESLAPEIARIRAAVGDTVAHAEATTALLSRASELAGSPLNDPVAIDSLLNIVSQFSTKDLKGDRLREISKIFSDLPNLTPMEQAVRVQKALGKDVSQLEKFLPFQKQVAAWEGLRGSPSGAANPLKQGMLTAVGGALGGIPGAMVAQGMSAGSNPMRALNLLTAIERASNAGAKKLSQAFAGVTNALTSGKATQLAVAAKVKAEPMSEKRQRFQHIMTAVQQTSTAPGAMAAMTTMQGNSPGLNQLKTAMSTRLQTASVYLNGMAPKDPMAGKSLLIQDSGWEPSDTDLAVFMRRVDVINDPTTALDRIAHGTVTLEEIDALRTVHPEIYASLQRNVADAIISKGKAIPYQTRVLLGTILGIPTDYSMTPEFIGKMQASYAQKDMGGRPEGAADSQPRQKNIDVAPFDTLATQTSNLTYGDVS